MGYYQQTTANATFRNQEILNRTLHAILRHYASATDSEEVDDSDTATAALNTLLAATSHALPDAEGTHEAVIDFLNSSSLWAEIYGYPDATEWGVAAPNGAAGPYLLTFNGSGQTYYGHAELPFEELFGLAAESWFVKESDDDSDEYTAGGAEGSSGQHSWHTKEPAAVTSAAFVSLISTISPDGTIDTDALTNRLILGLLETVELEVPLLLLIASLPVERFPEAVGIASTKALLT